MAGDRDVGEWGHGDGWGEGAGRAEAVDVGKERHGLAGRAGCGGSEAGDRAGGRGWPGYMRGGQEERGTFQFPIIDERLSMNDYR